METHPTTLQQRLAAMRNRIHARTERRQAANEKDAARILARFDQDTEEKFRQARSVIRHADFSDHGYMVANGLADF